MAIATRWHGVGGSDKLPPLLLVSLLLHLLVIAWPAAGRSVGDGRTAGDLRPAPLHAALNPAPAVPAPSIRQSARAADSASELAPVPRAAPSADGGAAQRRPGPRFYPSAALTTKPVALEEPEFENGDAVAGELLLTLWIDERGAVVAVADDGGDLPPDRRRAAADAFRRVRFTPGEMNGSKVGTVMRIAVNYDDEPLPIAP